MAPRKTRKQKLESIRLLLLDVDGVLTDGGVYYGEKGEEWKKFSIRDGSGIVAAQTHGIRIGLLTGRSSPIVARRAAELGITEVHQKLQNKLAAYDDMKDRLVLRDEEIAYVGDDVPDIPVLRKAGFSACPHDAVVEVSKLVDYRCRRSGGEGAVREVIDLILRSRRHGKR
ncbi:MAG TPA: HAD-IIIA family hydrolase [Bacteroidota bacterium]|nr:HAD-IIIA family hydrolase [Bacteroidota bacterium]